MDEPEIARGTVELRPGAELGRTAAGGLEGFHHFCFATYQRPDRLEWGALRALSEYRLEPRAIRQPTFHSGFDIITLVTRGSLRRRGTYSPRQLLTVGSAELVSTGRGVDLGMEAVGPRAATYIEIWIKTGPGLREPRREWLASSRVGFGQPLAMRDSHQPGALKLRGPAEIVCAKMPKGSTIDVGLRAGEFAYLSVRSGSLIGCGAAAQRGDALAIAGSRNLALQAESACELLLIRTVKSVEDGQTALEKFQSNDPVPN